MLLDPFYGVFTFGKYLSRWLNRLLMIAEAVGIYLLLKHAGIVDVLGDLDTWLRIPILVFSIFLAISIINVIIRFAWNIVLTFVYGTTDADTIIELRQRRLQRRRDRILRRQNRQTADWTRAKIISSRPLNNQELLASPALKEKMSRGRKAIDKL